VAWTEQAWRYSFAGITDPAQDLDEQQTHLALVGVANASDLAALGPQLWDYDESLTLSSIPHPAQFDVTTRYALMGVPAVGLTDSIDRDGLIDASLDAVTADFDGTVVNIGIDGDIAVVLDAVTASFVGAFEYRHYLDIEYSITPTWVVTEIPANFGDIDVTLDGITAALTGYTLPPDSTQGLISASLDDATAALDGTFVVAPTFSGDISASLGNVTAGLMGSVLPPGGSLGLISATLDGVTGEFSGSFITWSTDGDISSTLDGVSVGIRGQFIGAGAIVGIISATLDDSTVLLTGSVVLPSSVLTAGTMIVEDTSEATMIVEDTSEAQMTI